MDESTYTKIGRALRDYYNVPKQGSPLEKIQYKKDRVDLLLRLESLCTTWLAEHEAGEKGSFFGSSAKEKAKKRQVVEDLLAEVKKDLVFSGTFHAGGFDASDRMKNALIATTGSHKFALIKSARKQFLAASTPEQKRAVVAALEPGEPELLQSYINLREGSGLLSKEVKAIGAYTADQFMFMNPAEARASAWLSSNMAEQKKSTDEESVKAATDVNLVINKVAVSGLQKLPPWKHSGAIYRGETITREEAAKVGPDFKKYFPHFVSTSLGLDTPRTQAATNKSNERPVVIIYHIVDSSGGRDIAALSKSQNEQEILFPPGTTFTYVRNARHKFINDPDHIEIQVRATVTALGF